MKPRSSSRPAEELAALAISRRRPLDRELHVLGHELQRAVRVGPVEPLEVPLEERHATIRGSAHSLRSDADHGEDPLLEEVGDGLQCDGPVRPVPLPDAVVEPEDARGSAAAGRSPGSRRTASRRRGTTPRRTRAPAPRARAVCRASSSRGEPLWLASSPCSETSMRLRRTSSSVRSNSRPARRRAPRNGSSASSVSATKRRRKSSTASSMITYRQCCLDSK